MPIFKKKNKKEAILTKEEILSHLGLVDIGTLTHDQLEADMNDLTSRLDVLSKEIKVSDLEHLLHIDGRLAVITDAVHSLLITKDRTFPICYIYCKNPGTAGRTIIDVNKNGASVFDATDRLSLTYNNVDGWSKAALDLPDFAAGDLVTVDIDAVGTAAADMIAILSAEDIEDSNIQSGNMETQGLSRFNIVWSPLALDGLTATRIATASFDCVLTPNAMLDITGVWAGDAASHYNVYGMHLGARVITAEVTSEAGRNFATFSTASDTVVDGFELEVDALTIQGVQWNSTYGVIYLGHIISRTLLSPKRLQLEIDAAYQAPDGYGTIGFYNRIVDSLGNNPAVYTVNVSGVGNIATSTWVFNLYMDSDNLVYGSNGDPIEKTISRSDNLSGANYKTCEMYLIGVGAGYWAVKSFTLIATIDDGNADTRTIDLSTTILSGAKVTL